MSPAFNIRIHFLANRKIVLAIVLAIHLCLHVFLSMAGIFVFWDFFRFILFIANTMIAFWLLVRGGDLEIGLGVMVLIAGHAFWGHAMTPTTVTSAAMLIGNLLVFYVGMNIFRHGSFWYRMLFIASYLLLFIIFIFLLDNAEPLFLLALLGLAGVAKNLKLLCYFWAIILSFTFAQPYAWESVIGLFLILKMLFTARSQITSTTTKVFLGIGLLLLFFVLFPVLVMMFSENPHNFLTLLKDRDILQAVFLTFVTASISTMILAVISLPAAYAIVRNQFSGKHLLLSLIDIPIIIPQSVAGIALLKVFGKQQILGSALFHAFGIRFDGTILGIILAQVFIAMPFMMRAAMAAFETVPEKYEIAARNLGANSLSAYRRIALPLAGRGLFLGAILAWARAAGEFGAVFFIAASPETAPIAVYTRFMSMGLSETAPLVSMLLFFSVGMFFLLQLFSRSLPNIDQMNSGGRS